MIELTVSGFGISDLETMTYAKTLQVTKLNLQPLTNCYNSTQITDLKFEGHLCAGVTYPDDYTGLHSDSCQGDSGGPLTYR